MKNQFGHSCPVDWQRVDPRVQFIVVNSDAEILGFGEKPLLHESSFLDETRLKNYRDNYWESQFGDNVLFGFGYYFKMSDVSERIWQRPKNSDQ